MGSYKPNWDLSTIPDDVLHSEAARRRVMKRYSNPEDAHKRELRAAAFKEQREWRLSLRGKR